MKRMISFALAFVIVSAFVAGLVYFLGRAFGGPAFCSVGDAVVIGLSAGLAGTLAPIIAACISKWRAAEV